MSSNDCEDITRDSFDRFGDDLSQLILSYLTLSEKFKYECVCSQWQRLVFSRHSVLHINGFDSFYSLKCLANKELKTKYYNIFSIDKNNFESLLKKCSNIQTIKIDWKCICDETSLTLIADNCPLLKRFTISSTEHLPFSDEVLYNFGIKSGPTLQVFETDVKFNGNSKLFLSYCSHLKSINALNDCQNLIDCRENFLPKLQELNYLLTDDKDLKSFEILTNKYSNQMRRLSLTIKIDGNNSENHVIRSDLNELFKLISRFSSLKFLNINLKSYFGHSFADGIRLIGQKCPKLRYFDFETYDTIILNNIFNLFENFKALEYLSLNCRYLYKYDSVLTGGQTVDYGSIDRLAKCQHLTHLKLNLLYLNDKNLENIDSILPKLKLIELKSCKSVSHKSIESIAKLENLRNLRVFCGENIKNESICNLITKRPFLCDIYLDGSPDIRKDCLDLLCNNALKYPKTNYRFYYSGYPVMQIKYVPNNLKISNFWDKHWY